MLICQCVSPTALNGRAEVLVTLNIADFIPASHFRLPVSTPGAFLRQLQEEKT
ncbi:MAG: hypothetical protein U1D70_16185 [Methylobacter sp.]|nr:hypothetical protein [Methylobacter sp.]MDP3054622.1 hypothetical protein [Methylobacter sp.]MDP3363399.1 hypothetical protein [Methylobacter sp.]MDZ4220544.1 hypothetical protein [Methylobacter sp.]